jgi:uncharacterized membrane protein
MVEENPKESPLSYLLPRYFVHGLLFSLFGFFIGFLLAFIFLGLIVLGAFIGLIIGFLLLFLILGEVNAFLMERIWSTRSNENWKSMLAHGFILAMAFLAVSIPSFVISIYAESLPTTIVLFIVYCFIDGYIAKNVGSYLIARGAPGTTPIKLGYTGTLIVLLITAMAGTGFVFGLLLLVWSWLGGLLPGVLLFLTGFSGLVTLAGVIILSLFKGEIQEED